MTKIAHIDITDLFHENAHDSFGMSVQITSLDTLGTCIRDGIVEPLLEGRLTLARFAPSLIRMLVVRKKWDVIAEMFQNNHKKPIIDWYIYDLGSIAYIVNNADCETSIYHYAKAIWDSYVVQFMPEISHDY